MRGITPTLAMPYQDDQTIDTACLLREIDFLIQQGMPGAGSERSVAGSAEGRT